MSDTTQPERIMEPNYWPGWAQKVAELKAELEEVTERWLTRSAEVDTLKTKCANYQRQVGRMVERQDYEDRCERIAELESENRMRMGEAIERRGRIAELEAANKRLRELLEKVVTTQARNYGSATATHMDLSTLCFKIREALEDTRE